MDPNKLLRRRAPGISFSKGLRVIMTKDFTARTGESKRKRSGRTR